MINIRELILEILMEVLERGNYCHLVIRSVLEKYQYLDKRDRAFLTRVAEGTIQHRIELDYMIDQFSKVKVRKMKPVIRSILRMSVYQLKYMDSVPVSAACNEAVKLAKKRGFSSLAGFVNGVLRNISRNMKAVQYPDAEKFPTAYMSVFYSMPEWMIEQWTADYGAERMKQILSAFLKETPATIIRTNLLKVSPEELEKRLLTEQIEAVRLQIDGCPELDYGFLISGYDYLKSLDSFKEGLFYVQDISSMMAAELASPKEGDYIIDVCAAPGGKSIHLAEKMHGTGMVEARDLTDYKIGLIEENIVRQELSNIRTRKQDAEVLLEESLEKADIVMADLPCSGLGVMRRKPDIRYHMTPDKEKELAMLQRRILNTVCTYVKKSGTLIYSTCTIDRMENEENVQWFLAKHPEFKLVRMHQIFPGDIYGDGFFLAKFVKE